MAFAQNGITAVHYDTEDGLPQKTVMNIIQDQKGFIWFSTWDGICKFDGVNFYTYKVGKEDSPSMRSNRFDGMWLDKFGYLWVNTYEGEMYRFDPHTERFEGLRSSGEFANIDFTTHGIICNPSGKRWLLNPKFGGICFKDTAFAPIYISTGNGRIGNNHINKVFEDTQGRSWLLTNEGIYVFTPDLKLYKQYYTKKTGGAHPFYSIVQVGGNMLFGSNSGIIYRYDIQQNHFTTIRTNAATAIKYMQPINNELVFVASANDQFALLNQHTWQFSNYRISTIRPGAAAEIHRCYIDRAQNVWIKTDDSGIYRFGSPGKQLKYYDPKVPNGPKDPTTPRFYIWEDKSNRLWMQPGEAGLQLYDPVTDQFRSFRVPAFNNHTQSVILHCGYSDRQGNLWLSTRSNGVNKILFGSRGLSTEVIDPDTSALLNNEVRSIMRDHRGQLWVGTKGGKIFIYNKAHRQLGYLCNNGRIGRGTPLGGMAYTIAEDKSFRIYIGCKGEGLYRLTPAADSSSFKISHYEKNAADPYSLSDNRVYSILVDINQRIWIGTYGGGLNLLDDKAEGRFYNYNNKMSGYPIGKAYRVRSIGSDTYGNLYIGTPFGLFVGRLQYNNLEHFRLKHYERSPATGSLAGNDIYDIETTKKGETFIACFGGGLNKILTRTRNGLPISFKTYSIEDGLASNLVQQIEEDNYGKLWLSTESSISRLDPGTNAFQSYSDVSRLLRGEVISEGGATHTMDGRVLFGCSNGMLIINPRKLDPVPFMPYVAFTSFRIANKNVPVSDSTVLHKNIDDLQRIRLNYKQNFISIEFAALDFKNTQQLNYAYRLDGIDNGWVYSRKGEASYSNLAPGKYVFRVKSTNSYGVWASNEHRLTIDIVPAFWQTGWAWVLYILVTLSFLGLGLRWVYQYFRLKDRLTLEHEEAEMKTNFFTDISHEIRTPLTMIVTPVEHMLETDTFEPGMKEKLQLIHKNAARMLRLVNQVLDLRKVESQLLIVREVNAAETIREAAAAFSQMAAISGITIEVDDQTNGGAIWLDKEGLEKIMYNLLSNAVKYTPARGTVKVIVFIQHHEIAVRVTDSGRGMSGEMLQKLFSRFVSYNPNKSQPSTGIGLSIVKEIADRHHARVGVESTEHAGSAFTIFFQRGYMHFDGDPHVVILKGDHFEDTAETDLPLPEAEPEPDAEEQNTILIIEDDDDLRKYIRSVLEADYHIIEAVNGEDGMDKAVSEIPDFIVSDVMMPRMNGLNFLKQLRGNRATSHIPIIFLTARTDQETELKAYDYGADAFMTKPFNVRVLQSRIKTIIAQRRRLIDGLAGTRGNDTEIAKNTEPVVKSAKLTRIDEQFIKKIRSEIEKHISDSEFTVEDMIAVMPMSRTVFVKKLKSITGFSPIEFVRFVKIQYAVKLLEKQKYSIKEISNMVGISDTKYFAQRFKEIVGVMPSKYKADHKS